MKYILLAIVFCLFTPFVKADPILGGEITWECQANQFVFTLTLYQYCNSTNTPASTKNLRLWNHPSVHQIQANFISKTDISPTCIEVSGFPAPITCGNNGNMTNAIEKIIYKTAPLTISGIPPTQGWTITYDDTNRNSFITNLSTPNNIGITISATIFKSQNGNCIYNSPIFLQEPNLIICKGSPYTYNMNAISMNADSLYFELGTPFNKIANSFNPPSDPQALVFSNNYTATSPTPSNSFNPQNEDFAINHQTGAIQFKSQNEGSFVVKLLITSFKNGEKISTVQREIQITVIDCGSDNNQTPIITSDLPISNTIDIIAGNTVNLNFTIKDNDLLQNGVSQTVELSASGEKFGNNFTSQTTGCGNAPCATLSESLPLTFTNSKNLHFNWETSCNHLLTGNTIQASKSYTFVIKAKDDYCSAPKLAYQTFQINVHHPQNNLPEISCIQPQVDGSYLLTLKNSNTLSVPFYIQDQNNNTIFTLHSTTQTTINVPAGNYESFHIAYSNPCVTSAGLVNSIPTQVMKLTLQNPQNGTALLQWTAPSSDLSSYGDNYYIYQEYPAGTWKIIDSVPTSTNLYRDTITICKAFLNYQIGIQHGNCMTFSEIQGDTLQDLIAPTTPVIQSVSIDTLTNEVIIQWNPSSEEDTYGYIIYTTNSLGILNELDTVFGSQNTVFAYATNTEEGALTYSIAAFDSCFTLTTPPTFQTSAKSDLHTTIFAESKFDDCSKTASLTWNDYIGWNDFEKYIIYQETTQGWKEIGTSTSTSYQIPLDDFDDTSRFVIQGINQSNATAFSNITFIDRGNGNQPSFHYTKVATVDHDKVIIKHFMEVLPFMSDLVIQRKINGQFEEVGRIAINGEENEFIDSTAMNVNEFSYTYRVLYVDSCGNLANPANEVTTVLTQINQVDEDRMTVTLGWSPYMGFDGEVSQYEIYRSINNEYQWPAIYTASTNEFNFEDQLDEDLIMTGKVCYKVVAVEGQNSYGFYERSTSNDACYVFEPLIYIPNAFTPNGMNPIFYPVINLANYNNYQLQIFDRWNDVIFSTSDIHDGWDGIMNNGKKAPFGVYGYLLSIEDGNGKEIRKTGHVTIIWSNFE